MNNAKALIPLGFLLSLGLVISTYLVTNVVRDILMANQIIKVRGYAEIDVEWDLAIWHITVKAKDRNMTKAYPVLAAHRKKVLAYLEENGVKPEEIKIIPVQVRERMKRTKRATKQARPRHFSFHRILRSNRRTCTTYKELRHQ